MFRRIHELSVFLESFVIAFARGFLQSDDCFGRIKMIFASRAATHFVNANAVEMRVDRKPERIERLVVMEVHVLFDFLECDSSDATHRVRKINVDDFF